jgi:HPr kinase/phosphorylase
MSQPAPLLLHGSAVEWQGSAVLLRGPSGAGKSDLALRLIDGGAQLVADDQVEISRDGEILLAGPPAALAGLLEVRGLGILRIGHRAPSRLALVVDLVEEELVERLPEAAQTRLLGVGLPLLRLSPWPASAAGKVRLAMQWAAGRVALES